MFARRIIPAAPFLFLVFENLINRITIPKVKYSLVSIILLSAFFPVSVFSNVEQKIKGIANEKDYYTDSVIRVRKAQGELAGKTFGGLPARIMFQGGMLNFAYFSKLPYLVEMSGLTNYEIAKRKIAKRKYIGHEKIVEEKWVIDNGIHFLVMHDAPPFENVQSNRRPHRFNELYIKDSVKVSIVLYDDKVMDELREHPDVAFMPIEEVIDLFKKEMESKDSRVAKALLERLDTFYFRNSGPKGQVWRKELEEMISKK